MTEQMLAGSCLCGEVTFAASGTPHSVGHCHCRMCQKFAGAPFATWATYRARQVKFSGRSLKYFQSSATARRGFCDLCGSSVLWRGDRHPEFVDVCVALFDTPEKLPPTYAIWTASRISWLHADEQLPQYPEQGPDAG